MLYDSSKFEVEDRLTTFLECVKKSKSNESHNVLYLKALSQVLNIMYHLLKIQKLFQHMTPNYELYLHFIMEQLIVHSKSGQEASIVRDGHLSI